MKLQDLRLFDTGYLYASDNGGLDHTWRKVEPYPDNPNWDERWTARMRKKKWSGGGFSHYELKKLEELKQQVIAQNPLILGVNVPEEPEKQEIQRYYDI